jgi:hypothetical protein
MAKCEDCGKNKGSAYYRPHFGRVLCTDCNSARLRRDSPTGLVRRPGRLPAWMREANEPS